MTIVVEDGSIVTGANSYVSEAELEAYSLARGVDLSAEDTEMLLIKAMDYIESLNYQGRKVEADQPLQWPRSFVRVDFYLLPDDEIPQLLKNGLMQTAMSIFNSVDPLADIGRVTSSETVGPISVTYEKGQSQTIVQKINVQLQKLLSSADSGAFGFEVRR